jgi:hypothetical protein
LLNGKNSYHRQGDGDFFRYALQINILHPARTPNWEYRLKNLLRMLFRMAGYNVIARILGLRYCVAWHENQVGSIRIATAARNGVARVFLCPAIDPERVCL